MLTANEALTALDFERAIAATHNNYGEPTTHLITAATWDRAQRMKADPRLQHYDIIELIAYAEVDATPQPRTASYSLGKSYRRAARKARRAAKKSRSKTQDHL